MRLTMKRLMAACLTIICFFVLWAPAVRAEEAVNYYNPEDEKLTHLELLELMCTGYPGPDYERYPEPPVYIQQDYAHVQYGTADGSVSTKGCGITTASMLASYMLDEPHDPADMVARFKRYGGKTGTEYRLFDDVGPAMGFDFIKRTGDFKEVVAALEDGRVVVSLQRKGPFTTIHHFILLSGLTEDGKIIVKDANRINYDVRFVKTDYFENGFPVEVITRSDYIYWIYGYKLVRIPGCSRCADPEGAQVPILLQSYYCEKCSALMTKQDTYHAVLDSQRIKPEI